MEFKKDDNFARHMLKKKIKTLELQKALALKESVSRSQQILDQIQVSLYSQPGADQEKITKIIDDIRRETIKSIENM